MWLKSGVFRAAAFEESCRCCSAVFFLGSNFSEETMATMWFYKYTAELEGGGGLRVIC